MRSWMVGEEGEGEDWEGAKDEGRRRREGGKEEGKRGRTMANQLL